MAAPRRRRLRGDRAFKKLIKRLPDDVREELLGDFEKVGAEIVTIQQGATVSGRLRRAISKRVLRGALQLKVGIVGRPLNRRLWWAKIVEKGRKANVVTAARRTKGGGVSRYLMRVSALAARPFIYSSRAEERRTTLGGRTRTLWERALNRAAAASSDN